ncbi:hypothetical protein TEQG_04324 [Trichophyton equinum CBS 127.97]|uniref:Uncharacterized protein n=1 Tax=Trichophyton equinum (strain ATCC MYA-4606 / CBS 127.97) TaxID=559882 RepID=F2PU80_TRIEC|nr:hypothetical protein TEQG_04324 [Trichophyton equinum CBS 127.97]
MAGGDVNQPTGKNLASMTFDTSSDTETYFHDTSRTKKASSLLLSCRLSFSQPSSLQGQVAEGMNPALIFGLTSQLTLAAAQVARTRSGSGEWHARARESPVERSLNSIYKKY